MWLLCIWKYNCGAEYYFTCKAFLYAVPGKFKGGETTPFMKVMYSFFNCSVSGFPGSKLIICLAIKLKVNCKNKISQNVQKNKLFSRVVPIEKIFWTHWTSKTKRISDKQIYNTTRINMHEFPIRKNDSLNSFIYRIIILTTYIHFEKSKI